jgi:hypothetical protein
MPFDAIRAQFPELEKETLSRVTSRMLTDPCLSYRFKNALTATLTADPVDALKEAELLHYVAARNCDRVLAIPGTSTRTDRHDRIPTKETNS